MERWVLSEYKWASEDDLNLPFWSVYNRKNPDWEKWTDLWERPFIFSRIPWTNAMEVSGAKDYPAYEFTYYRALWDGTTDLQGELTRILMNTRNRTIITVKIGDEDGLPLKRLRELEGILGERLPNLPTKPFISSSKSIPRKLRTKDQEPIRILGIVIDSRDAPRPVAILIPHWESPFFLRMCLAQIIRCHNPILKEEIYVLDDTSMDGSYESIKSEFSGEKNIHFHLIQRADKSYEPNVGYLLDMGLSFIKEQYVAMIDADLFPITDQWLTFPIWAIESMGCSSVGMDSSLSSPYCSRYGGSWWQPKKEYLARAGIYDNDWFSVTNNLYRVMPTALAKVVSENIGFRRSNPRSRKNLIYRAWLKGYYAMNYLGAGDFYTHLSMKSPINPRWPYLPEHCDNGVAGNHFIDINRLGPKFNIPLTSCIGLTPDDYYFGQNISGLVFHYALSTRALSSSRREIKDAGSVYYKWVEKLTHFQGQNDHLVEELIKASSEIQDLKNSNHGIVPKQWFVDEYNYIQSSVKMSKDYYSNLNSVSQEDEDLLTLSSDDCYGDGKA